NKKTDCIKGIIIPAPIDCMVRPMISVLKSNAIAANNVPIVNTLMAVVNNCLVVYLSIKKAVTGIMIPLTIMKIVVSHCAVLALTTMSCIIRGMAVISVVCLSIEIKPPDKSNMIMGFLLKELSIKPPLYFIAMWINFIRQ